jgi:hypothetical protein
VKLEVFFRDELLGTITLDAHNQPVCAGPSAHGLEHRVAWFQRTTGLQGQKLLQCMLEHLQGHTWARKLTGS